MTAGGPTRGRPRHGREHPVSHRNLTEISNLSRHHARVLNEEMKRGGAPMSKGDRVEFERCRSDPPACPLGWQASTFYGDPPAIPGFDTFTSRLWLVALCARQRPAFQPATLGPFRAIHVY